jgi:multidrug efflux pump subunit AcrA (membrane-fusion protein)
MSIKVIPLALAGLLSAVTVTMTTGVFAAGNIVTVQGGSAGGGVALGGTVVPRKEVTLSAQVPGRIEILAGEEGDQFDKGTVLVAVDEDDLLARRKAAWAELAGADAKLRNAGVQYSREWVSPYGGQSNDAMGGMPSMFNFFSSPARGMMPGGGSPGYDRHADLYTHGTEIEQARSSVTAIQARIEEIDAKLRDTKSLAPFDGVITRKMVEIGDSVQPGMPLLQFADTTTLQARVEVPARLMPGVREGMVVPAKLDVGDTRVSVRVARIFPVADATRHTVTVKFDIPQGAPAAPGMYIEVSLPDTNATEEQVPIIPMSSLVWRGSLPGVYVVSDSGSFELRLVRLGNRTSEDYVEVISGLAIGEQIQDSPPSAGSSGWNAGGGS